MRCPSLAITKKDVVLAIFSLGAEELTDDRSTENDVPTEMNVT